jgi:hypothetical protein
LEAPVVINEELAIPKVEEFLDLLENFEPTGRTTTFYAPGGRELIRAKIDASLSLIKQIADECDPDLTERIHLGLNGGWGIAATKSASAELLGYLRTSEDRREIFNPAGPKLAASQMHHWIWGAAGSLWDDGHHAEAVSTSASALFDVYLPGKLNVPKDTGTESMVAQAFKLPGAALRIPGFDKEGEDQRNAYQGAQNLGMACSKLVRNLTTHNVTSRHDETELLEELAMLSRFARIVDSAN